MQATAGPGSPIAATPVAAPLRGSSRRDERVTAIELSRR